MDLNNLQESIKEIIELVDKLPEIYRLKAFEILLTHVLVGDEIAIATEQISKDYGLGEEFVIPIDVRAMFSQYQIEEDLIHKLFLIEGDNIRHIYPITTTVKARAQIQVACLLALENALGGGKFSFANDTLRERLNDLKVYDSKNFSTNFRNNSSLFKSLEDDTCIELSAEGKSELADIIVEITK